MKALVGLAPGTGERFYAAMYLDRAQLLALAVGIIASTSLWPRLRQLWLARPRKPALLALEQLAGLLLPMSLLLAAAMQIASGTHNPFIYFRF
jgi:alginate O-acetyltransferase complex protein AlgI